MEPVAPERRQGGDELGEVAIGGFSFPVQNVDGASRMEAPTPTRGAPATLQQIPAAALLEAALESEARVATLQEAYEELVQSSMTGVHATPRSRMDVPPTNGSTDGDSMRAGRLRPLPVRETIFAWDGKDGNGDTPEAHGAAGQMLADMQVFRAQQGIAPHSLHSNRRDEAAAIYDGVPHRHGYDGQDGARPGWPHQSVGVPGPAQRVMSQAPGGYSGNRHDEAVSIYDGVHHRPGYDGKDGAQPGWQHQISMSFIIGTWRRRRANQ